MPEFDFRTQYRRGDTVIAAVDHPEGCAGIPIGVTGTVRSVSSGSVLIDWDLPPGKPLHNGQGILPRDTGWFIHRPYRDHIRLIEEPEEDYDPIDLSDLF